MDTGTSSHPSYTSNAYGVISVHPTPLAAGFTLGAGVPSDTVGVCGGEAGDAAGGHAHHRGSGGGGAARATLAARAAAPRPRRVNAAGAGASCRFGSGSNAT